MYEQELQAIERANRYRERELYDEDLIDLASNDYLGLAERRELLDAAVRRTEAYRYHAPRASQLVNGYHPIHAEFEALLCRINGFEKGIVVGSGFLANLSLIEALPRKRDLLVLDASYHASGVMASRLVDAKVRFFRHNDPESLDEILSQERYRRAIVAVEGIYSMEGDLLDRAIFDVADRHEALLIVDEAHSSGVIGKHLSGVFEHYGITPRANHIKMGTLGKAMGSYGAYILGNQEIIAFLQNRAKAIIYATAPSVIDTALATEALHYLQAHAPALRAALETRRELASDFWGREVVSPILRLPVADSHAALNYKQFAKSQGYLIGAIRPPTVPSAILRIILRANVPTEEMSYLFEQLRVQGV